MMSHSNVITIESFGTLTIIYFMIPTDSWKWGHDVITMSVYEIVIIFFYAVDYFGYASLFVDEGFFNI